MNKEKSINKTTEKKTVQNKTVVKNEAGNMQAEKKESEVVQTEQVVEKKPKKFAFFIGCTIQVRLPYIEKLTRNIFKILGVELVDLGFSCCPTARIARDVDIDSWLVIAARNLAVAEKEGLPILSMCTGCTQTLTEAKHLLEDIDTKKAVNEKLAPLGLEYQGKVEIKFYAELIYEMKNEIEIKKRSTLRIAAHPGCHILRPSKILKFDDPENPTKLDDLIRLLGADAIDYPNKALCCGFPIFNVDPEASKAMMMKKMTSIDADCMAVLCPTCFEYYELRQKIIATEAGFKPVMVLHYLQLLGISMGLTLVDVGFEHLKFKEEGFSDKL